MVTVAQTIIDESAMMVKSLDAFVAVVTVSSVFRPQILTVNAHIVKMKLLIDEAFHEAEEITFHRDVSGVN